MITIVFTLPPDFPPDTIAAWIGNILWGPSGSASIWFPDDRKWDLGNQGSWFMRVDEASRCVVSSRGHHPPDVYRAIVTVLTYFAYVRDATISGA